MTVKEKTTGNVKMFVITIGLIIIVAFSVSHVSHSCGKKVSFFSLNSWIIHTLWNVYFRLIKLIARSGVMFSKFLDYWSFTCIIFVYALFSHSYIAWFQRIVDYFLTPVDYDVRLFVGLYVWNVRKWFTPDTAATHSHWWSHFRV